MMTGVDEQISKAERKWNSSLTSDRGRRISELCKAKDWQSDWFRRWCNELREPARFHRKQWEFIYVMQSLWERGCIQKGKKGLAFAVGSEPLPSIFANYACNIVATDIYPEQGKEKGWTTGDQLCFGIESLNKRGLCDDDTLRKQVQYRAVDMNDIPADLKDFDFNWSSCSFEHLGTIEKGVEFLKNQLKTLKPGGWAVHTTEFNVSSNEQTLDNCDTVIFRMSDIEKLVRELRRMGHKVETLDYSLGGLPEDFAVDVHPHKQDVHLKLQLNEFVVTSIGLIIQKKETNGSNLMRKILKWFSPKK
jgi:SAM-dependent methyltransferase